MKYFPLKKQVIGTTNSETGFLDNYTVQTQIPVLPHPGAFAKVRRFHQHEGVDIYCNENDEVVAIEDSIVIGVFPFTGNHAGTNWWNDTWCILMEGESGVLNYGELIPQKDLQPGACVKAGQVIGFITPVLKKDKGRPMNMLHLEMYEFGTKQPITGWDLNQEKPQHLCDPTALLLQLAKILKY